MRRQHRYSAVIRPVRCAHTEFTENNVYVLNIELQQYGADVSPVVIFALLYLVYLVLENALAHNADPIIRELTANIKPYEGTMYN